MYSIRYATAESCNAYLANCTFASNTHSQSRPHCSRKILSLHQALNLPGFTPASAAVSSDAEQAAAVQECRGEQAGAKRLRLGPLSPAEPICPAGGSLGRDPASSLAQVQMEAGKEQVLASSGAQQAFEHQHLHHQQQAQQQHCSSPMQAVSQPAAAEQVRQPATAAFRCSRDPPAVCLTSCMLLQCHCLLRSLAGAAVS